MGGGNSCSFSSASTVHFQFSFSFFKDRIKHPLNICMSVNKDWNFSRLESNYPSLQILFSSGMELMGKMTSRVLFVSSNNGQAQAESPIGTSTGPTKSDLISTLTRPDTLEQKTTRPLQSHSNAHVVTSVTPEKDLRLLNRLSSARSPTTTTE